MTARALSHFTRQEVARFFTYARRIYISDALTILIADRQKENARILTVASRKVGNAPERNKIKRRLRALFYENRLFEGLYDIAIIIRPSAKELSFAKLQEIVVQAVRSLPNKDADQDCS